MLTYFLELRFFRVGSRYFRGWARNFRGAENFLGELRNFDKLMNNQLPTFFVEWRPKLPRVCTRYDIRSPVFHLPVIKHKFAEQSHRYCLIKQLNRERCSILNTSKVHTPFSKDVFKGGGVPPPPQKIQIFFVKSEGKEVERKTIK